MLEEVYLLCAGNGRIELSEVRVIGNQPLELIYRSVGLVEKAEKSHVESCEGMAVHVRLAGHLEPTLNDVASLIEQLVCIINACKDVPPLRAIGPQVGELSTEASGVRHPSWDAGPPPFPFPAVINLVGQLDGNMV